MDGTTAYAETEERHAAAADVTRNDFIKSILALGIAGSIGGASADGMMRGRVLQNMLRNGGDSMQTITYDGSEIANCKDFFDWVRGKVGSGPVFVVAKYLVSSTTQNQIYGGCMPRQRTDDPPTPGVLRWRDGKLDNAYWSTGYLGTVSTGDRFYVIPLPQDALV